MGCSTLAQRKLLNFWITLFSITTTIFWQFLANWSTLFRPKGPDYACHIITLPSRLLNLPPPLYYYTVAVWTQKKFFPPLIFPQGSQGCQKIIFFFHKCKCFPFALRLPPKDTNSIKPSKLRKKCQKKPCFLRYLLIFFNFGAILEHQTSTGMLSESWRII